MTVISIIAVENLIVEAKYKVFQKIPSTEIDFEEFVKLYINHRPAFGDSFIKIRNAFHHFANRDNDGYYIYRDDLVDMLNAQGECFPQELSWYLLSILNGQTFEDRAAMMEGNFSFLPEKITFEEFVTNIIGIHDLGLLTEQYSVKSFGSPFTVSSESIDFP